MILFNFADYLFIITLKTEIEMDKQIELSLSVDYYTSKPKNIAQIRYKRRTFTQNSLMVVLNTGYCVAHCFKTQNEIFTQSEKTNENFEYTQMIGVDIDDCDKDMETFIGSLKRKPTFAYTTFSNGIKGKGNRFRMIYLFNQKIDNIPLYKAVYNWITDGFNITDNCMRSVSQQMFGTNFAAKWYKSDIWYDVPHFDESIITNQSAIFKVQKSTTQNQLPKTSHKYPSEYNKKEEVHYNGMGTPNKNGHLISDNTVVKALYSMSPQDFICHYRQTYDYFTATPLHYENGYALLPDDYCEITRPWYREQVGDNAITVVRTLKHGDKRKIHMTNTAVIIRKIKNDITFEHLLYILVCERQYYYDNSDKVLSNKELVNIAKWATELPIEQINPKKVKHPKFKIDKAYWRERGITARQAANIVRGMLKSQEIGSMYDFNLTDAENVKVMKDYGLSISINTLRRWRKSNGIEKTNKKNNIHKKEKQMKQDIIKDYYNPQLTDEQNVKLMNENDIKVSINTLRRWRKSNGIQKKIGGDHCSQEYKSKKQLPIYEASTQNQSIISKASTQKVQKVAIRI